MLVVDSNSNDSLSNNILPINRFSNSYPSNLEHPHAPFQLPIIGGTSQKGGYIRAGSPQSYLTCSDNAAISQNNNINVRGDVSNPSDIMGFDPLVGDIQGTF